MKKFKAIFTYATIGVLCLNNFNSIFAEDKRTTLDTNTENTIETPLIIDEEHEGDQADTNLDENSDTSSDEEDLEENTEDQEVHQNDNQENENNTERDETLTQGQEASDEEDESNNHDESNKNNESNEDHNSSENVESNGTNDTNSEWDENTEDSEDPENTDNQDNTEENLNPEIDENTENTSWEGQNQNGDEYENHDEDETPLLLQSPQRNLLANPLRNSPTTFTLTFDSNGGSSLDSFTNIESWTLLKDYRPQDPVYNHHMFLGRFDENDERVLFSERIITGDLTLTAKWGEFEEILYTGIIDDAEVSYTLMDRNLGATSNDINDASSDGYYYQRGNNYGFERSKFAHPNGWFFSNAHFITTPISNITKPFYNERLIKNTKVYSVNPQYLRGGENDTKDNNYDSANARSERQGPCPVWYHIPSLEEMDTLLEMFFSQNNINFTTLQGSELSNRVNKESKAELKLTQEQYDRFIQTFKVRMAGRLDPDIHTDTTDGDRYVSTTRPQAFWSISSKGKSDNNFYNFQTNNNTARKIYFNLWGWADTPKYPISVRCFKDETDLNIKRKNEDGTILEHDEHLDFGSIPEYNGPIPTKASDDNYRYQFSGWNQKTTGPLKRNMTFRAVFTKQERSGYIVTFSGTNLPNQTIIEGQKVEKPEDPFKEGQIFLGRYADYDYSQTFDFSLPITQDTVIYAKWEEDDTSYIAIKARSFPITYHFGDSLVFSWDRLINTDLHLFTTENMLQDFLISMGIDGFSYNGVANQATVFAIMSEQGEPYPGILVRKENGKSNLEFLVNATTKNKDGFYKVQTGFISFARFNQSIYSWTENNHENILDIAGTPAFNYPLVIWWSLDENKDPWRLMKGTLSNVKVKVRYDSAKPFQFPEPTQSWWDFIGRYKDANLSAPATTRNINSGDILYPKWEPITYVQYTFNAWSGVFSDGTEEKSDSYKVRNPFPKIEEPILSGYHFIGRSEDKINLSHENTVTLGDKTFYALYEAQGTPYTVEHYQEDLNGSFFLKDTETKTGITDTLTNATAKSYPWFSLSGEIEQKRITWDGSTIVQIYYKRNEYTITFNTNGGSSIAPITAKYWSLLTSPNVPTKYGYTFDGWTPAFPSEMPVDGATLQAKRKANRVHITFDKKGGTGGTDEFWFTYGISRYYADQSLSQKIMDIIPPTRTWYLFKGYKSESERYVAYDDNGNYIAFADDLSTDLGEDITLTAIWEIQKIHITLDPQGGTGGTSDFYFSFNEKKYYTDENLTQEISKVIKPQKTGYLFQDYFSESIGERFVSYEKDGTRVELDSPSEDTYYRISKNTTLKARRTPKKIHITLDKQGGTGGTNGFWYQYHTPTFYADENLSQILTRVIRPQRTGYTFKNYRTEQERYVAYEDQGTMIEFADDLHFDLYQDTILKATWEANDYRIHFVNRDHPSEEVVVAMKYDQDILIPDEPFVKTGYTFKGRENEQGQLFQVWTSVKNLATTGEIFLKTKREEIPKRSFWSSWWLRLQKDYCPKGDFSDSYYDNTCEKSIKKDEKSDDTHGAADDEETNQLYEWAKETELTSTENVDTFRLDAPLTRSEMAKIVSIFLQKFLGQFADPDIRCTQFTDIAGITSDLHDYIIEACNLWIMGRTSDGQWIMKFFYPHNQVTKAEVVTILSRMFWGNEYKNKKGENWYEGHLRHLIEIWVIDSYENIFSPFTRKNFYMILKKLYPLRLD